MSAQQRSLWRFGRVELVLIAVLLVVMTHDVRAGRMSWAAGFVMLALALAINRGLTWWLRRLRGRR